MSKIMNFTILTILVFVARFTMAQENIAVFPQLNGPYLAQTPPGMKPEVFAPGIISTDAHEGCVSFTQDGTLFLFARAGVGILQMNLIDGKWTEPELTSFSAGKCDWDFMLAPDDKTVFVSSGRPDRAGDATLPDYRLWTTERKGMNWSKPFLLPPPVNTGQHDSYPSITKDGTLYFFSNRADGHGQGDVYRAKRVEGKYPQIENLGPPINTAYHDLDSYVAPDEGTMIFSSKRPGGFGGADFYISFRNKDDKWSSPINMGEPFNSEYDEYIPYVTPDGKYFFFTSNKEGNREIYWVDARVLDKFRSK